MLHLHVTSDAWKARYASQNYAVLTAHFITPDFTLESRVVAAKPFLGKNDQRGISEWHVNSIAEEFNASLKDVLSIKTDGAADMRAAVRNQAQKASLHCYVQTLYLALSYAMCFGERRSRNAPEVRKLYESVCSQCTTVI